MASALVQGMLQADACKPEHILVINRHPDTIKDEVQQYGLQLAPSQKALVQQADTIVLGTKPADSVQLLRDVRQFLEGKLLISVAAGITLQTLQDAAGHRTRVIRAMPNTPSLVKQGAMPKSRIRCSRPSGWSFGCAKLPWTQLPASAAAVQLTFSPLSKRSRTEGS